MKQIAISGSTGYLGQKVFFHLRSLGIEPIAILRNNSDPEAVARLGPKRILHWGKDILPKTDTLMILGTLFSGHTQPGEAHQIVTANVLWPVELAEAYLRVGGQHVIAAGTCWERVGVYRKPANTYAASKESAHLMLAAMTAEHRASLTWLRLADTFSIDDPRKKIFQVIREAIIEGRSLDMTLGEQDFDPLPANEAALALSLACIEEKPISHGVWGISGGSPSSLRSKIERYCQIVGKRSPVRWGAKPYRFGEPFFINWTQPPPWWNSSIDYEAAIIAMESLPRGLLFGNVASSKI